MGDSLRIFIDNYCVIDEYANHYIKLSRFKECYKGFCSDNGFTIVTLNEIELNKYGVELIIMNKEKWLKGIRLKEGL